MNGYTLTKSWFNFCSENPEKIRPNHTAVYCFAVEHCNQLGWKKKFGLPSAMTMEVIGIKSYNTYKKTFEDLVEWGFFKVVERSKNQYTANIIALSKIDKAPDKANAKHLIKQDHSTEQSNDSIIKHEKPNKPKNEETDEIDWSAFLDFFKKLTGKNLKSISDSAKRQFRVLLEEGYEKKDILKAIINAQKDPWISERPHVLTFEFISKKENFERYLNYVEKKEFNPTSRIPIV